MHIDIFLPEFNIAIEVDGPFHFKNIFGEEELVRVIQRDYVKNWLLLSAGYFVIRAQFPKSYVSDGVLRDFSKKMLDLIQYINITAIDEPEVFEKIESRVFYLDASKRGKND